MYLYKNVNESDGDESSTNKPIDLSEYFESFGFFNFLYHDKKQASLGKIKNERIYHADFAASVVAQLFAERANDDIIVKGLHCCRDILLSKGYRETILSDLHDGLTKVQGLLSTILVAGCQTEEILTSRVDKAITLIRNLHTDVDIVFAGNSPRRESIKIPDESVRMKNIYDDKIKQGALSPDAVAMIKNIRRHVENNSTNTEENVRRFFQGDFVSEKKNHKLYIVSSTFHLLRLAKECEAFLNSPDNKRNIKQIILCGADDINRPSGTSKSGNYIKLMFFDIFAYLMEQERFFQIQNANLLSVPEETKEKTEPKQGKSTTTPPKTSQETKSKE